MAQAQPITIKLLESEDVITLDGAALPSAVGGWGTINFETTHRVKTTYYPGNPVATQQRMGPTESNTTISGIWRDTHLGNGTSALLRDAFDGLCRTGAIVEVTWGSGYLPDGTGTGQPIVRRGLVKRFKHTYERPQDIQWEVEFEWRGRDEAVQPPLQGAGQGDDDFSALSLSLEESASVVEAFRTDPLTQIAGFSARIDAAFDTVNDNLSNATDVIDTATAVLTDAADLPNQVLERVRGTTTSLFGTLQDFEDTILDLPLLAMEFGDNALGTLDLVARRFDMLISLDGSLEKAAIVDADLAARQTPEVIAEVRPLPGTDFRDLARQFYGDPDLWWVIASYNGFPSSSQIPQLPDGPTDTPPRPIKIPRRTEGAQGSLPQVC